MMTASLLLLLLPLMASSSSRYDGFQLLQSIRGVIALLLLQRRMMLMS